MLLPWATIFLYNEPAEEGRDLPHTTFQFPWVQRLAAEALCCVLFPGRYFFFLPLSQIWFSMFWSQTAFQTPLFTVVIHVYSAIGHIGNNDSTRMWSFKLTCWLPHLWSHLPHLSKAPLSNLVWSCFRNILSFNLRNTPFSLCGFWQLWRWTKVHCFPGVRGNYRDCSETGMIIATTKGKLSPTAKILAETKEMLSRSHPLQRHYQQLIVAGEWDLLHLLLLLLLLFFNI